MRFFILSLLFLVSHLSLAQANTEIFLFDVKVNNGVLELSNAKNISDNEGYDNQPSFVNDNEILFSSNRNGQTDIVSYRANYNTKTWLNFTEGGEYTPLKIPNQRAVSAVRLDKDGKQRLYSYSLRNSESTELIEDLVVAYYTWYNEDIVVSAAIEDNNLNLFTSNLKEGWNRKYDTNVGRSFQKIPNSQLVSFISKKEESNWQIKSLDPYTGATRTIANTLPQVEDICWLINGAILTGKDNFLYKLDPRTDREWKQIIDLSSLGIKKITRIASNSISSKLLIAAEIDSTEINSTTETGQEPETTPELSNETSTNAGSIVQKHIGPFNMRDLDGFVNAFSENVIVSNYPNKVLYEGRDKMRSNYERFFINNDAVEVNINNRIVIKDMVVDEEIVSISKSSRRQATIYKTGSESIQTMTFIANTDFNDNPEAIVDKQLKAYNERNINAFMATYSEDVKLYSYPDHLNTDGQDQMRKSYNTWFNGVSDLHATIKKRIVIGNKVIDQEQVTANGRIIDAIAIYEVKDGLIKKVTFIQ